jgi:hypothetical protein
MKRRSGLAVAGALLLALALAAELALVAPLRAEQAALQAVVPPAPRADAAGPQKPAAQLAQFNAAFPPLDALADALAGLDSAARQAGVPLRSAEYRLEQRAGADAERLARYRIALRTAGDYAQIRGFLGQLLQAQPFVALDDVQFRRAGDATLEADMRLSVYLRRQ